jgi:transcriptional regulator with PAS, ATPase and Fis domain
MPRHSSDDATRLLSRALSAALGPALLLDSELRIVLATDEVSELLGAAPRLGTPAPAMLCGQAAKRPVAEALAEGRAIQTVIPHPRPDQAPRTLRVRSQPLEPGWLLLIDEVPGGTGEPVSFEGMWTQSPRMKRMFEVVRSVASEDLTVLVRGETGTGKELVARAIHNLSLRRKGPFRAINCAALPANLLESELFGHVRGAFTGAVRDNPGHVQLAHRGTLFLDEVAELPLELQAKLLRVLETRSVLPVGAREPTAVDVRFVSATHRALRQEVEANRFRADLMYRLRVVPIFLPALRERREDIALLAETLIQSRNATARRKIERIAAPAMRVLERYDWPGNIRELQNVIAYAGAIGEGPLLQLGDLPPELLDTAGTEPEPAAEKVELTPEGRRILEVLARAGGNKNKAAKVLGVSRVTLWRKLQALGPAALERSRE